MNNEQKLTLNEDTLLQEANEVENRTRAGGMLTKKLVKQAEAIMEKPKNPVPQNDA